MDEEYLREIFGSLPDVRIRRMFGGQGIYSGETIFAVVVGGELYLKSDSVSEAEYEEAGCRRWTYAREGKLPVSMPYFSLPDDALDDPDVMAEWARRAFEASRRPKPQKAARKR